jgi:molecular chaperone DnaK
LSIRPRQQPPRRATISTGIFVAHVLDLLRLKPGVDVSGKPRAMSRILGAAEAAKKHPSDHLYVWIEEEYLAEVSATPVHLSLELVRDKYEQMITPFVEETLQAIQNASRAADLTASQADEILFVSGATCSPMIRRTCARSLWPGAAGEADAELCVAIGAAIQGAAIVAWESRQYRLM